MTAGICAQVSNRPRKPPPFRSDPIPLDLRGLKCPLPALKTRKALTRLSTGQRLCVEATDPLSVIDIPHVCQETGDRLIAQAETDGVHCFTIEKA